MILAGARHLPDFDSFYRFFGAGDHATNTGGYDRVLAPKVEPETRAPFARRIGILAKEYHHCEAQGRFIGTAHPISGVLGVDYQPDLASRTLEDQQAFFDKKVATRSQSRFVRTIANRRALPFGLGIPPAQCDTLRSENHIADVLCDWAG